MQRGEHDVCLSHYTSKSSNREIIRFAFSKDATDMLDDRFDLVVDKGMNRLYFRPNTDGLILQYKSSGTSFIMSSKSDLVELLIPKVGCYDLKFDVGKQMNFVDFSDLKAIGPNLFENKNLKGKRKSKVNKARIKPKEETKMSEPSKPNPDLMNVYNSLLSPVCALEEYCAKHETTPILDVISMSFRLVLDNLQGDLYVKKDV